MKNKRKKEKAVLTFDPSLCEFGWAVITCKNVVESGCIKTENKTKKLRIRAGDDRTRRLDELANVLLSIIKKYDILLITSELPHGSQSASAAMSIGLVTGLVHALSRAKRIPLEWYSEGDAKKAITKKEGASKDDVIKAVVKKYKHTVTDIKYVDKAVCDAIAVYHAAYISSPVLKYILKRLC